MSCGAWVVKIKDYPKGREEPDEYTYLFLQRPTATDVALVTGTSFKRQGLTRTDHGYGFETGGFVDAKSQHSVQYQIFFEEFYDRVEI